jgi:septum formation protein
MPLTADSPLLLGSSSPRRREILEALGVPILVDYAAVNESRRAGEPVQAFIERVVLDKLGAVAPRAAERPVCGSLVADTIVVLDGDVLGKPESREHARELLGRLAGRTHTVFTRYAVATASEPARPARARTVSTRVTLRAASDHELDRYAATGEGADKAGAYAAQGIGAFLVERIEGSFTNVVGLPACEVVADLVDLGLLEHFP